VILETERMLLRKPRMEDADALFALHSDPEAMRFVGGVRPELADTVEAIRHWLGLWERNGVGHFVAERRDDGAVLGRIGYVVWDTSVWEIRTKQDAGEHAQPELGWALAREHWGSGYATEGAGAARDWFRREHGDARLISVIAPANERSARVAGKLGCTRAETIELPQHGPAVVWEHP
jgi:RimJ/RimL family protein N-acetyltransferase